MATAVKEKNVVAAAAAALTAQDPWGPFVPTGGVRGASLSPVVSGVPGFLSCPAMRLGAKASFVRGPSQCLPHDVPYPHPRNPTPQSHCWVA
jgi:hypothetical protein